MSDVKKYILPKLDKSYKKRLKEESEMIGCFICGAK